MPKGELKNLKPFSKNVFDKARAEKGYSLRSLAQNADINLRTLCRAMNSGTIKCENFEKIARFLDIQPSLLSGTYPPLKDGSVNLNDINLSDFPYSEEITENKKVEYFVDLLLRVLTLFDVSTEDINNLDTEIKYKMLKEMVLSIENISNQYFHSKKKRYLSEDHKKLDYSGAELMLDTLDNDEISEYTAKSIHDKSESEEILDALEQHKRNFYNKEHANITLREELLKKKPRGYTKKQISKMNAYEILNLDKISRKRYCMRCGSCISDQIGFNWDQREWTCTSCGGHIRIK